VDASHVIGTAGSSLYRYASFSGSSGTLLASPAIPDPAGATADRMMACTVLRGKALLAVQSVGDSHVSLYDLTDPTHPVWLASGDNTTGTLTANSNGTGDLAWGAPTVNGDGTVSVVLYAMSSNQGIQAYVVTVQNQDPVPQFTGLSSPSIPYGTASVTLTGTLGTNTCSPIYPANGDPVTAAINGHAVAGTVTDSTGDFTITYNDPSLATDGANTYAITYAYAGNANIFLGGATNASTSLTVTPVNQSITFGSLANQTYGVAPYALNATASSGLAVSFSVLSGPANILGSTITITGAGLVTVQASQAGNANYNAATPVTNSFTVFPLPVVLTGSRLYDGTATAAFGILSVANKVGGDDVVVASGSATLASSWVGTNAITSAAGLTLGGTTAPKYTLTGASGAVVITNPHLPFSITSAYFDNTGTNFVMVWQSIPGVTYQVKGSGDVTAPLNTWTNVGSPINATAATTTNSAPRGPVNTGGSFFDVFVTY
jgi:hypothetical protein